MIKAKIHGATITETHLHYSGSLTLDPILMEEAGILPGEKVQIVNLYNGARMETYVIPGVRGSRSIHLNGPAARLGQPGDVIHIIAYAYLTPEEYSHWKPTILFLNSQNQIIRKQEGYESLDKMPLNFSVSG